MSNELFEEFAPTSKELWQQQAIKDLRGKDIDILNWNTDEGFVVAPYYSKEDLSSQKLSALYNAQAKEPGFLIQPLVRFEQEMETNQKIVNTLSSGANAVVIDFCETNTDTIELSKLLYAIKLSDIPVVFRLEKNTTHLIDTLAKIAPYQLKGGICADELAMWVQTGNLSDDYFQNIAYNLRNTQNSPTFKVICVDGTIFHNAGANATQELAAILAVGITYLDQLTNLGIAASDVFSKLYFSVAVGTNYFMEIAKLRALRYLWVLIQEQTYAQFEINHGANTKTYIHAHTSTFYDAALTPNTNMLRATTEAMSAVIGGCDALTIHPYDSTYTSPDEFSERIARNIATILKEESYLDKVADAAAGSYFLDSLTLQLADAAWALFLEIENKGGFMATIKQNFIQDQIETTYQVRLTQLQNQSKIMVGVNKFKTDEATTHTIQPKPQNLHAHFKLLKNRRIAENFENKSTNL